LAWQSISVDGIPTVFQNLVAQGLDPVFGFYLSKANGEPGEMMLGGYNSNHMMSQPFYVPLINETYWEVALDSITLNGKRATQATRAVLDTGTSLLAGPTSDVTAIATAIGAKLFANGEYTVDCSKVASLPSISVQLNGQPFVLTGSDYVLTISQGGVSMCLFGLVGIDMPPEIGALWILGDVFIRKYYTVFDWGNMQVGLAQAQ